MIGYYTVQFNDHVAALAFRWSKGEAFSDLLSDSSIDEGDLVLPSAGGESTYFARCAMQLSMTRSSAETTGLHRSYGPGRSINLALAGGGWQNVHTACCAGYLFAPMAPAKPGRGLRLFRCRVLLPGF